LTTQPLSTLRLSSSDGQHPSEIGVTRHHDRDVRQTRVLRSWLAERRQT
jgi:hypothetical protein